MDITNITADDIAKMTDEERREYVRELIHAGSGSGIRAAFYNPEKGETYTVQEMLNNLGEEKTIDLVCKALASNETEKQTITKAQFDELRKKRRAGIPLTEEEERMLEMINASISESDMAQYQKNTTGTILTIMEFAQTVPKYNPLISDLLASINMIVLASLASTEGTQTRNYKDDFGTLTDIAERLGNDVIDTWRASCTTPLTPEMEIIGLSYAVMKIAAQSRFEFVNAKNIFEALGLDSNMFVGDVEVENGEKNGSNTMVTPDTYVPSETTSEDEDENMRNLLKE